jgi:hypothetical protein
MKKFLSIALIAIIAIVAGCSKDENPRLPEGIVDLPLPLLVQDTAATSNTLIQEVADFSSKFSVQLYWPEGRKPKKFDIVVARNGEYDAEKIKVLKADVSTFPTEVSVTGPQLATLFGIQESDIVPGDKFEIRANITLNNGTVLPGFIPDGLDSAGKKFPIAPYGTDVSTFPGSNLTITYRVVCPLELDDFVGTFTLTDPDFWEDSYPVQVTREGDDLIITGFVQSPSAKVRLKVKQSAQTITVPKQAYLATLPGTPYHNPSVAGSGVVDACNTKITLSLENTVDEGSFGASTVTLEK